ncbi:MAG: relaxase, partial [Chitinophagaceae bacterium]
MVARILSGKSIRGMLSYNETKVELGEAKLILASGFATDIDLLNFHQKLYRFEQLTRLNSRVRTNAMHISLNFHVNDKLDPAKLQQISAEYMDKIGLGDQPFIVYQHLDASHPHLHIATTLIQKDGKRMDTERIGEKRSEPARKDIEKKYNLIQAQGRQLANEPYLKPAQYGAKSTKQQLNNITKAVMRDYAYTSFEQYKAVLAQFNVQVERGADDSIMFAKKGLIYSILDTQANPIGVPFKASAFFHGATMKRLEKHFENNKSKRLAKRQELIDRIDGVLLRYE